MFSWEGGRRYCIGAGAHSISRSACRIAVVEAAGWRSAMWQGNVQTERSHSATTGRTGTAEHLQCAVEEVQ